MNDIVAALIATYAVSRVARWALHRWNTSPAQLVAAHGASWLILALFSTWVHGWTPDAGLKYIPAQLFWLAVDLARIGRIGRLRRRRHSKGFLQRSATGKVLAGLMLVLTAGYLALAMNNYLFQVFAYNEVYVGNRAPDVLYAAGRPDFVRSGPDEPWRRAEGEVSGYPGWLYRSPRLYVQFDGPNGQVEVMYCEEAASAQEPCPSAFGIRVGDHENLVGATLGRASREFVDANGRKVMSYPEAGKDFILERFRVQSVRSYDNYGNLFQKLWRFVVWLTP